MVNINSSVFNSSVSNAYSCFYLKIHLKPTGCVGNTFPTSVLWKLICTSMQLTTHPAKLKLLSFPPTPFPETSLVFNSMFKIHFLCGCLTRITAWLMQWMQNSSKNLAFIFFYNLFCNLRSLKEEWTINLSGSICLNLQVLCVSSVSPLHGR